MNYQSNKNNKILWFISNYDETVVVIKLFKT